MSHMDSCVEYVKISPKCNLIVHKSNNLENSEDEYNIIFQQHINTELFTERYLNK